MRMFFIYPSISYNFCTLQEGKAFLKRGPKAKKAKKEAPVYKEVEEDEDESA